jgi:DNA-binding transcriptional LysR family regulator
MQLRAFLSVVDTGSFSDAAKALGVSQPAVTMQVQALEADTGATLLDRRYRRIDLTDAGKALLPHARAVIEQIDAARDEIETLSGRVTGRLVISASTTPGVYVVPKVLGGFLAAYPEVGVSVSVADTAEVVAAVEDGTAHLGLAGSTVAGARVLFEPVGEDRLVLVAPPGHPLAEKGGVRLGDLFDEVWVMREAGSGTRRVAEQILADNGLDPAELRVAVELSTGEAVLAAVEGGLGISILSRYVADKALKLGSVVEIDAVGLPFTRPLFAVLPKKNPTRAAQAFFERLTGK